MSYKDTGIIERTVSKITREELIEWRIPDFSILVATSPCLESPIFIVNDVSWFLTLYLRMGSNLDFLRVYIETKEIREYTLEYTFSLKKSDGSMEHMVNGILEGNRTCSDSQNLIKRSEILQRNSELTPQDVATLICKLKYEIIHPTQLTTLDKTKTHKLISK